MNRRTVMKGAAWSIPVITAVVATPLAAASAAAPALTFVNGPYAATACGPLGEMILNLTADGTAPDPGKTVTVTLPAGLRWADGSTGPKVFSATDAAGNISIPAGEILGSTAGSDVITATSDTGATSTAPVTVSPNLVAKDWNMSGGYVATFANPAATAVGWNFFFGPGGTLYHGDTLIASNVSSAVGDIQGDATNGVLDGVAYVDENGVAQTWVWNPADDSVVAATLSTVPAGSRAVGWNFFLAPNGDLYYGNDLVDSGVTSAVGEEVAGGADSVTYVSNGQPKIHIVSPTDPTNPTRSDFPAVPTGVTAVGHNFFLAANGDLYHATGTLVASGVTAAVGDQLGDRPGDDPITQTDGVSYVQNGVAMSYRWFPDGSTPAVTTSFTTVPAGSTPVGWNFFLAPGGALYHGNDLIASNVVSAVGGEFTAGNDGVTYVESVTCD